MFEFGGWAPISSWRCQGEFRSRGSTECDAMQMQMHYCGICCAVVSTMRAGKCYTTPGQSVTGRITASNRLTPLISLANPLSLPLNFSLTLQVAAAGTKEGGVSKDEENQSKSLIMDWDSV